MGKAVSKVLEIFGWLGIILGILVLINTVCGIIFNMNKKGEKFSFKILFKGLLKALVFYLCSGALAIAFTMLPYVNEMITNTYGIQLIANETLNTLSAVAVLGIVINAIVTQGKKAIEGIQQLLTVKVSEQKNLSI